MGTFDTNNTMRRSRAENASFVIEAIRALGITLHPQSRLMQMHRILTQSGEIIAPDDPGFETALEAERDMQLLGFVFDHAKTLRDCTHFESLVKRMLSDSVLPQDDPRQSKGRDAQFELYVAAICHAAGLTPVEYREPDVICTVQGVEIGVAAKRSKSEAQVKKRIPKAAKQIHRSGLLGVIALDTSVALNPNNKRITTPIPDESFGPLYSHAINCFLGRYDERIRRWVRDRNVLGLIVHDHQVRHETDGDWSLSGMTTRFCIAEEEHAERLFRSFELAYVGALPNMQIV